MFAMQPIHDFRYFRRQIKVIQQSLDNIELQSAFC